MEKGTNFRFVTTKLVTRDSFVLIGVVETLNCRVTFSALESSWTLVPTDSFGQHFTVFGCILENLRRSSKITHMVRVNTTLAIVAILFSGTPSCLVHEHVKDESVLVQIQVLQVVVEVWATQKALRHEIVFD